jgi:hypothetical protein
MKCLIVTTPARGHLNNAVALHRLLSECDIVSTVLTGSDLQGYSHRLFPEVEVNFLPSLNVSFNRRERGRLPHLRQAVQKAVLLQAVDDIAQMASQLGACTLIGKDVPAASVAAHWTRRAYYSYVTGGPSHLIPSKSPHWRVFEPEDQAEFDSARRALGLGLLDSPLPDSLHAAAGYFVRGTQGLGGLTEKEQNQLPSGLLYCGWLTADEGERNERTPDLFESRSATEHELFASLGTLCQSTEAYRSLCDLLDHSGLRSLIAVTDAEARSSLGGYSNVEVNEYVAYDRALDNARIMLHHGGFGAILSCLVADVAMLCWPQNRRTSCQVHQSEVVEKLGLGIHLKSTCLPNDEVFQDACRTLLSPSFQRRFQLTRSELQAEAQRAVQETRERLRTWAS